MPIAKSACWETVVLIPAPFQCVVRVGIYPDEGQGLHRSHCSPSDGCSSFYTQEQKVGQLPTRCPVDNIVPRALVSGKPFCPVKSVWEGKPCLLEKNKNKKRWRQK